MALVPSVERRFHLEAPTRVVEEPRGDELVFLGQPAVACSRCEYVLSLDPDLRRRPESLIATPRRRSTTLRRLP